MTIRRVHRKIERTAEELAELRAVRDEFQRDRPGPDELASSGEYEGPYRQGDLMALLSAIAEVRRRREQRGLSLAEVSERSGLDKGMLSRLENGKILNPTLSTLWRYAEALGMQVELSVGALSSEADEANA